MNAIRANRPSLRAAVQWIAHNDDVDELDMSVIAGYVSVALVAELFGKSTGGIAARVVTERARALKSKLGRVIE